MIAFVDASAIVAMMTDEPDTLAIAERFGAAQTTLCSAIAVWEATRAVARKRSVPVRVALREVEAFMAAFGIDMVRVGTPEAVLAVEAHDRYGKGNHPARLNLADCFAYACAKTNGAELLYKGDDFALTDLR